MRHGNDASSPDLAASQRRVGTLLGSHARGWRSKRSGLPRAGIRRGRGAAHHEQHGRGHESHEPRERERQVPAGDWLGGCRRGGADADIVEGGVSAVSSDRLLCKEPRREGGSVGGGGGGGGGDFRRRRGVLLHGGETHALGPLGEAGGAEPRSGVAEVVRRDGAVGQRGRGEATIGVFHHKLVAELPRRREHLLSESVEHLLDGRTVSVVATQRGDSLRAMPLPVGSVPVDVDDHVFVAQLREVLEIAHRPVGGVPVELAGGADGVRRGGLSHRHHHRDEDGLRRVGHAVPDRPRQRRGQAGLGGAHPHARRAVDGDRTLPRAVAWVVAHVLGGVETEGRVPVRRAEGASRDALGRVEGRPFVV
mmetsp:Transcript_22588/g.53603  ORF Transcript_22588/g.53603 Transcript_22588/m.53603 type:complete len:365 (-) Transcript_22588:1045-2139(-)